MSGLRRRLPGERALVAARGRVRSQTAPPGDVILGDPSSAFQMSVVPPQDDEAGPALRVRIGRSVVDVGLDSLVAGILAAATPGYDDDFGKRLAICDTTGPDGRVLDHDGETWGNDRLTVHVQRFVSVEDDVPVGHCPMVLSVHTHNRDAQIPWRILQRVKNEVAGPGRWAAEWFPDEDHLVDEANERHLWVLPAGFEPPAWMASSAGRMVGDTGEASEVGAQQDPLPEWYPETQEATP